MHEWVDGKPPTHSRSLGFVKCAPPAPRPLPLAITRRASSLSSCLRHPLPPCGRGGPFPLSSVRRECRPDLGTLALHQRIELLPLCRRTIPRRLHRHAVVLLSRRAKVLHRR